MIKLTFQTITPLHISNGEELGYGIEYIVKNNVFLKLNLLKVSKKLSSSGILDFSRNHTINNIIDIIKKSNIGTEESEYKISITKGFFDYISNENAIGQKFVKEFINTNGNFYIPGSSVKGVFLTILGINSLGIDPSNAYIYDKFIIRDSDTLTPENFIVIRSADRPPAINLICLKKNCLFDIFIAKKGKFDIDIFKNRLKDYTNTQINNAISNISNFSGPEDKKNGTNLFIESLQEILNIDLKENEYLINLGFGGGSWFKIEKNKVPKFKYHKPSLYGEPAHTSFTFNTSENNIHIGWCKLKIKEE